MILFLQKMALRGKNWIYWNVWCLLEKRNNDRRIYRSRTEIYTEKAAGNICGCIGFVKDKNTKLNVPNTLLKKDIRDVTAQPTYKVFAVISKHYTDEKYTNLVKMDKSIDLKECCFSETIENMIDRENL